MTTEQSATHARPMRIGLVMPIAENDETRQTSGYAEVKELALQAEATGFDSIWVFDHLLFRLPDQPTSGIWEAWTILAALAAVTKRVTLGTLVLCTGFRNPALLAKMAATLDEISDGRLILGLGAGWHQPEYDAFGFPFDHRVDRFEEALQIIVPLLREGHVDFEGRFSQARNAELRPRGPRADGPPILIGASKPRMLRLTARYATSWNTGWLGQSTALPARRAPLEEACRAEGRDPATLEVTVGVAITTPGTKPSNDQPEDPTKALAGSAEDVANGLRAYAEMGVGHVICSLSSATTETFDWMAGVLQHYRQMEASAS